MQCWMCRIRSSIGVTCSPSDSSCGPLQASQSSHSSCLEATRGALYTVLGAVTNVFSPENGSTCDLPRVRAGEAGCADGRDRRVSISLGAVDARKHHEVPGLKARETARVEDADLAEAGL